LKNFNHIEWQPKGWGHVLSFFPLPFRESEDFGWHPMLGVCQMLTNFFQSPSNTPSMSNGDQISSITQKGMEGKGMKWQ
jgi:hypothetical protein